MANLVISNDQLLPIALPDYAGMIAVLMNNMSIGSQRQYNHTYDDWKTWCIDTGIDTYALSAPNVMRYLQSRNLSRATRQARLTHQPAGCGHKRLRVLTGSKRCREQRTGSLRREDTRPG